MKLFPDHIESVEYSLIVIGVFLPIMAHLSLCDRAVQSLGARTIVRFGCFFPTKIIPRLRNFSRRLFRVNESLFFLENRKTGMVSFFPSVELWESKCINLAMNCPSRAIEEGAIFFRCTHRVSSDLPCMGMRLAVYVRPGQ
jgi:hypothetical protein